MCQITNDSVLWILLVDILSLSHSSTFTFEIFPGAGKLKIEAESPMIEGNCVLGKLEKKRQ